MKKRIGKFLSRWIFVACMIISATLFVNAEESTAKVLQLDGGAVAQEIQDITSYRKAGEFIAPKSPEGYSDYIFAGWYTNDKCTTALGKNVTSDTIGEDKSAYAKFVPEEVLSVKAQIPAKTDYHSQKSSMRFVTTVDSLNYESVGFDFVRHDGTKLHGESDEVYKKLYALDSEGEIMDYTPWKEFHSMSKYFMACNIRNITNVDFGHGVEATPYWVTLDGTKVLGVTTTKTVGMGYTSSAIGVTVNGAFSFPDRMNYSVQGGCTDGEYYYQALVQQKAAEQENDTDHVYIFKYDMKKGEWISDDEITYQKLWLHHANDMTYNADLHHGDREGLLVVAHNAPQRQRISFLNPDTLSFVNPEEIKDSSGNTMVWGEGITVSEDKTYITIEYSIFSINYNAARKKYVVGISGGQNFRLLDASFRSVSELYTSTSRTTGFTTQGNTADDGLIYFVLYNKASTTLKYDTHVIAVYDWDGNFVTVLKIPKTTVGLSQEPENISVYNNKIYISCANGKTVSIYQINAFQYPDAATSEASIVRNGVTHYYQELEDAMMGVKEGETITILKEKVEVNSLMEMVVNDVTLTNAKDVNVTISRSTDYVDTLIANSAHNFTIKSNEAGGSLTFNGDGTQRGKSWIVNSADGELHLENIAVMNVLANQDGGAVSVESGKTVIKDCSFVNNQNSKNGGAIYSAATLTVEDSIFKSNSATNGGAIYNGNSGTVEIIGNDTTMTVFEGNTAEGTQYGGGAICIGTGSLSVTGYKFQDNHAFRGGAIAFRGGAESTISNTTFEKNTATTENGGAIHNRGHRLTITDSKFNTNSAPLNGGALYNEESGQLTVGTTEQASTEALFSGNHAGSGGAIGINTGSAYVKGYTFKGNDADETGGAFYITDSTAYAEIENCEFTSNEIAENGTSGGAIRNAYATVKVTNSTFTSNTSATSGGAVYNSSNGKITFIGTTAKALFKDNKATGNEYGGGAICIGTGTLEVDGYTFEKNYSENVGGAITHRSQNTAKIKNASFEGNYCALTGGAVFSRAAILDIDDTDFIGNYTVEGHGGAIYQTDGAGEVTLDSTTGAKFEKNKANGETSLGGAIYVAKGTITANGYTFTENEAACGGAIYHAQDSGNLRINDSVFNSNKSTSTKDSGGGAIYNLSTLYVANTSFDGNTAVSYGGAIRHATSKVATIESCKFTNNQSTAARGGAIYGNAVPTINLTVKAEGATVDTLFQKNYGKDGGGAICIGSGTLNVTGYTFDNNSAGNYGGAVRLNDNAITATFKNSVFSNNKSGTEGGALFSGYSGTTAIKLDVTNCKFDSNSSTRGGAIFIHKGNQKVTILAGDGDKAIFTGNSATNGGAIYTSGKNTESSVTGYTFTGNTPQDIYKNGGTITADGNPSTN